LVALVILYYLGFVSNSIRKKKLSGLIKRDTVVNV